MTLKILHANGTITNDHPTHPATMVGSGNVLADSDDATYIESGRFDFPYDVGLETLTGYESGDPITLHVRLSVAGGNYDPPNPPDAHGEVFIATSSGYANSADEIGGFSDGNSSGFGFTLTDVDGAIVDVVVPLSMAAWSPSNEADVVATLEAGAVLDFNTIVNSTFDTSPTFRVYEAWVEVGVDEAPPGGGIPPRRIFGRTDGKTHGAPRLFGNR